VFDKSRRLSVPRAIATALHIIKGSELLKAELLADVMEENKELCRTFTALLKTARSNSKAKSKMANGKCQIANGK
jgi:hypothetical protein